MKKTVICLLLFLLLLSGCTQKYREAQMGFVTEDGALVAYGMSQNQIESVVGTPDEVLEDGNGQIITVYPNGMIITYRNNLAVVLVACHPTIGTSLGVWMGDDCNFVKRQLGTPTNTITAGDVSILSYVYQCTETSLIPVFQETEEKTYQGQNSKANGKKSLEITFFLEKANRVSRIIIAESCE